MNNRSLASLALLVGGSLIGGCAQQSSSDQPSQVVDFTLPEPISNNAVAHAIGPDGETLYSFNGLRAGKSWADTSNAAFACAISTSSCKKLPPVPVAEGRLASAAVTIAGKIYIFGGYSVAENGDEVSTPEVFAFDPMTQQYLRRADMPTPVDDMVALPYQDRYIYLVSGWHDEGNVSVVQLYDTKTDQWQEATEFPGKPVFGHAGGIAGNSLIISDGVAVAGLVDGKRKFAAAKLSWRGDIDPSNPATITWRGVAAHDGVARYRMAAVGDDQGQRIIFAGGGDNPYNYDGIGYDGVAAEPADDFLAYDLKSDSWQQLGRLAKPSMDHRGLIKIGGDYYIIGGMDDGQQVTDRIVKFRIAN